MWNWHEGKVALEYLFFTGQVGAARRINFERLYDLPSGSCRPRSSPRRRRAGRTPSASWSRIAAARAGRGHRARPRRLLPAAAGRLQGCASPSWWRAGELIPVTVEGWDAPAYLWPAARRPRRVQARALLSPFDPLIWFRPRTERLFGFRYRIEIYTPAAKRIHGYYVLPFLLDDALVARVDLKSDRQRGVLLVQGAFAEDGVDRRPRRGRAGRRADAGRRLAGAAGRRRGQAQRRSAPASCRSAAVTLRAILFDLDDTLIPERPAIVAAYRAIAQRVWGDSTDERTMALHAAARQCGWPARPAEYARRVAFQPRRSAVRRVHRRGPRSPTRCGPSCRNCTPEAFEARAPPAGTGSSPELVDAVEARPASRP